MPILQLRRWKARLVAVVSGSVVEYYCTMIAFPGATQQRRQVLYSSYQHALARPLWEGLPTRVPSVEWKQGIERKPLMIHWIR